MRQFIGRVLESILRPFRQPVNTDNKKNDDIFVLTIPSETPSLSAAQVAKEYASLTLSAQTRGAFALAGAITIAQTSLELVAPQFFGAIVASLSDSTKKENSLSISIETLVCLTILFSLSPILSNLRSRVLAPATAHNTQKLIEHTIADQLTKRSLESKLNATSDGMFWINKGFSVLNTAIGPLTIVTAKFLELLIACVALSLQYGTPLGLEILALTAVFAAYCIKTTGIVVGANENMNTHGEKAWESMVNTLNNAKIIQDFGKSVGAIKAVREATLAAEQAEVRLVRTPLMVALGHILIVNLGTLALLLSHREQFTAASFVILFGYTNQLNATLPAVGKAMTDVCTRYADLERLIGELKKESEVIDRGREILAPRAAPILFDRVRFAYAGKAPILEEFSCVIPSGKIVAFVGASGKGKSTIFNLLMRHFTPATGCIKIGDCDTFNDVTLESLRSNISVIEQNPTLFKETIRSNIVFAAEMTDENIFELAKRLNLAEFVCGLVDEKAAVSFETFQKGLDIPVGKDGGTLSGGQRQKVAILRGFAKEAPIRLLDEVTAALDKKSANMVMAGIKNTQNENNTTIIITHDLPQIASVDIIFVVHKGRVQASGTHEELLRNCDHYQELWAEQESRVVTPT